MQQHQGEWTQCAASVKSPQASEDPEGSNQREAAAPQPGRTATETGAGRARRASER